MLNSCNKKSLKNYRDSICSAKDIKETFDIIKISIEKQDFKWIDEYNYLLNTIKKLKHQGYNVGTLEKVFRKYEKETFEPFGNENN